MESSSIQPNPTGFDTKIMKNCGKIHLKRTKLDLLMNKLVILVSCHDSLPGARHWAPATEPLGTRHWPQSHQPSIYSSTHSYTDPPSYPAVH